MYVPVEKLDTHEHVCKCTYVQKSSYMINASKEKYPTFFGSNILWMLHLYICTEVLLSIEGQHQYDQQLKSKHFIMLLNIL